MFHKEDFAGRCGWSVDPSVGAILVGPDLSFVARKIRTKQNSITNQHQPTNQPTNQYQTGSDETGLIRPAGRSSEIQIGPDRIGPDQIGTAHLANVPLRPEGMLNLNVHPHQEDLQMEDQDQSVVVHPEAVKITEV